MIVIEGSQCEKSNTNDIMHVCADGKDWKGSRHVMGHDMKRRTSKVCLDDALVMIYAALVVIMFPFYPQSFSLLQQAHQSFLVTSFSVLSSRGLGDMFQ